MNNLEVYIRESIFDKDVEKKVRSTSDEILLDLLKEYTYEPPNGKVYRVFDNNSVWTFDGVHVKNGKVELDVPDKTNNFLYSLNIQDINSSTCPGFQISKVAENVCVWVMYNNIKSLKGIFTPDCDFRGLLYVEGNSYLTSLKGCPKECGKFTCYANPKLPVEEVKNGPKKTKYYDWDSNKPYDMTKDTMKAFIEKYVDVTEIIQL